MSRLNQGSGLLASLLLVAGVAACGGGAKHDPSASSFYEPAIPLPAAAAGTLIRSEEVKGIPLHPPARIWRILYHSRGAAGGDVAMSGFVVVPRKPAIGGVRPAFAWAHGTAGLGDQCAPSKKVIDNLPPYGGQQAERGAMLVAPDYEGLGTPGVPPYAVGDSDAHALLDATQAAAALPGVGAIGPVVVAGHSEGGRAALLAGQIARDYAPKLHIVGALSLESGALPQLVHHIFTSPYRGADIMGTVGLSIAQPTFDLASVLTDKTLADVKQIEHECVDAIVNRYKDLPPGQVFKVDPSTVPAIRAELAASSPTRIPSNIPVFMSRSGGDEQVPPDVVQATIDLLCHNGSTVATHAYTKAHDDVIQEANDDVLAWLDARFSGQPVAKGCA